MKISNASKKVLASALSAAMVVAFAPAAAFATPAAGSGAAKYVSVTFDSNGNTAVAPAPAYKQLLQEDGKYYVEVTSDTQSGTVNGYSFSNWFIDANSDGVVSEGEAVSKADATASTRYFIEVPADATAVTLKAAYNNPVVNKFAGTEFATGDYVDPAETSTTIEADVPQITATVANDGVSGHTYVLTVKNPNDVTVATKTFGAGQGQTAVSELKGSHVVSFSDKALSSDDMATYKRNLLAGEYKVTLTDNGKEVSSQKLSLATITVKVGSKTETGLAQVKGSVNLTEINGLGSDYKAYVDADDYYVADAADVAVKGDATYTAVEQETLFSAAPAYDETDRNLTFTVSAGATDAKYAVSVDGPSGTVYTAANSGAYTVSFDQTSKNARTSASEQAGDYVVTATITEADGTVKTAKTKFTLTEVKVEAGEGTEYTNADAVHSFFTDDTAEAGLASFVDGKKTGTQLKDGFENISWQLNGAAAVSANKAKAGQVNTLTSVATAKGYAAAPEYSVAKVSVTGADDQYILSLTPAAGTTLTVTGAKTGAAIAKGADGKYNVTAENASGGKITIAGVDGKGTAIKTIELVPATASVKTDWAKATAGGKSPLEANIGNTTTKWLATDGVKAAVEAGKAAVEAYAGKYFAAATEGDEVEAAAYKALYEAVAAEADAQVKAYENGALVVAGKKVYSMTADQYNKNVASLEKAKKNVAAAVKTAGKDNATLAAAYKAGFATTGDKSAVKAAQDALTLTKNVTEEKYKAEDVTAAADVTAALKAAKTADEAKAALEAYSKLSDDAKKLVATADVAAAQKIVTDAEMAAELKNAQDDAAVSKVKGKTVKAKAKKATKSSLKVVTSKSGAKSTFKKVTKNSKVTVSKSGKIDVKKGLKAGKKYTVKVKATVGTQTKTVKVIVKVAK